MARVVKTSPLSLFGAPRSEVEAAFDTFETVVCPVCAVAPEPFATDYQGFHLAKCPRCGLQFQSPRPVFSQLAEHVYSASYTAYDPGAAVPTPDKHLQFQGQLVKIERFAGGAQGSLLDVGCGTGAFLTMAEERGFQVAGADIVESDSLRGAGIAFFRGRLKEIDFGDRKFDVVRFNHVLEHTENPLEEIRLVYGLLRMGGVLFVSVPNLAGLSARLKSRQSRWRLKRRRWRHYAAMHHFWFFTPRTLMTLLKHGGYEVLRWETPLLKRTGRAAVITRAYGLLLEPLRAGSILDCYCRKVSSSC